MVNMDSQNGHQLTIPEAATALGISIKSIRRWIKNGKLKATKIAGRWFVDISNQDDHSNGQHDDQPVPFNGHSFQPSDQTQLIEALQQQIEDSKLETNQKNEQIQELHQIIAMQQKSIQQLTEQNQLLLEDKSHPWWKRIFRR